MSDTKKLGEVSGCEIHGPNYDGDEVSAWLCALTRELIQRGHGRPCYGMAGPYGYGVDFRNAVFSMHWDRQHPECDCGGSKPKHLETCDTVTKRDEWLNTRNSIGFVPVKREPLPPLPEDATPEDRMFRALLDIPMMQNTPTTYAEQDAWMKANPFPSCSCGEERAWLDKHGLSEVPDDNSDYFDRVGSSAREFDHTEECDLTIYAQPHFEHKPTGLTVRWYKGIGRSQEVDGHVASVRAVFEECFTSIGATMEKALADYAEDGV
jgi:hypothetical protein